jgi:hypothetical protein
MQSPHRTRRVAAAATTAAALLVLAAPAASAHASCVGNDHTHQVRHYSLRPVRTWTTTEHWDYLRSSSASREHYSNHYRLRETGRVTSVYC